MPQHRYELTDFGMSTKLPAICDSQGCPLSLFVTTGRLSDYIGAKALLSSFSDVDWLAAMTPTRSEQPCATRGAQLHRGPKTQRKGDR